MAVLTWILGILLVFVVALIFHLRRNRGQIEDIGLPVLKPILCFGSPPLLHNKIIYHEWVQEKFKKLGRTFARYEGVTPAICTIDPEFIKEVTVKQFENFTDTVPLDLPPEQTTLDGSRGETWKSLRKMLSPSFTAGKLKSMMLPITKIADNVIEVIEEKSKITPEMDLKPIICGFTLDVISNVAFGLSTNVHKGEDKEFSKMANDVFQIFESKTWGGMLFQNFFTHFPDVLEKFGFVIESAGKLRQMTHDLIEHRNENNTPIKGDFIDRLREFKKDAKHPVTDEMIDAQGIIFLTAGFETTANTIGSFFYALATLPEIQENIYQEILANIGNDEITHENVASLSYLEASINETLRMYPPVNEHVRTCVKDTIVNGIKVKKGFLIKMPTYAAHYDSDFFPEPTIFKPERFLKNNADQVIPYTWRPFGCGNRVCIGQRFAILEIKLFMAKFLSKFKLKATSNTKRDKPLGTGSFFIITYPEIVVKVEKR